MAAPMDAWLSVLQAVLEDLGDETQPAERAALLQDLGRQADDALLPVDFEAALLAEAQLRAEARRCSLCHAVGQEGDAIVGGRCPACAAMILAVN